MVRHIIITVCLWLAIFSLNGQTVWAGAIPQAYKEQFAEAKLISLAAATCAGTYKEDGAALEYRYLGDYGWKIRPFSVEKNGVTANFMVATTAKKVEGRKLAVVAFRGSKTTGDWKVNFKVQQEPFNALPANRKEKIEAQLDPQKIPSIHRGFNQYVNAALSLNIDLDEDGKPDDVLSTLKKDANCQVLICGHSLGGAAATILAERLVSLGVPKERIPVVTFGAPAVGNAAFAEEYGPKIDLVRVVTSYDPVPASLQKVFGGYKQFGKLVEFPLAGTYTDFQHPISFYFDLAVKHYYDVLTKGEEAGYITPLPEEHRVGQVPLVAIAVTNMENNPDQRYAPDIKRFVTDEYKTLFPSYIVLTTSLNKKAGQSDKLRQLLNQAAEAKAPYLVFLDIDRHSMGQTDKWYVTFSQAVFTVPEGNLVTMGTSGTRVTFNQGIMQSTIATMEQCRKDIEAKLPFVLNKEPMEWRFGTGGNK